MFSYEWMEFNNVIIESKTLVLKFNNSFAPKLGEESPLKFEDINFNLIPDIESFLPVSYTHLTLPTNREV